MRQRTFPGGAYARGESFNIIHDSTPMTKEASLELVIKALVDPSPATLQAVRFYKGLPYKGLTLWQHLKMWWTGKYPVEGRYF